MTRIVPVVLTAICLSGVARAQRQRPTAEAHTALIQEGLAKSSLVNGHTPFHLILDVHPGKVVFPGHEASPAMRGTVEVFWRDGRHFKLLLTTPNFKQTKIVDGARIEETDTGDFLPRWLDDFVRALFDPLPQAGALGSMALPMTGGGTVSLPGRAPVTIPRCLAKEDQPGGVSDEMTIARACFDPDHPWIASGADFTRYVSFKNYLPFAGQMIPRTWTDDIPENIFVEGTVTRLEKLNENEAREIRVQSATASNGQIRTVFLSREMIDSRKEPLPTFEWPAEDTEALEGWMIVYIRTDRTGKIREAYWDSSDNYKLQDSGVRLALLSRLKPLTMNGVPVQIEGPMVLHFKTRRTSGTSGAP